MAASNIRASDVPSLPYLPLCRTFASESEKIWADLFSAYASGRKWGEETVTDTLLKNIEQAHPYDVITLQFSKPQEGIIGADWEWWLTDGRLWLGLLIQAKRLNPLTGRYPSIKHWVGPDKTPQIDLLLRFAEQKAIDPLYFFYNYTSAPLGAFTWNCGSTGPTEPQFGCTVAHARAVKKLISHGGAGLPKMSRISYPLRCLVCCTVRADPDDSLPGRAFGITRQLREAGELPSDPGALPDIRDSAPPYVYRLLETPPEGRARLTEELRPVVGPIGTLVIIKEHRSGIRK